MTPTTGITTPLTLDEATDKLAQLRVLRAKVDAEIEAVAKVIAVAERPKITRRSRYVEPECGTESGYQRHRYKGERCPACVRGHAEHQRDAEAARKALLERIIDTAGGAA